MGQKMELKEEDGKRNNKENKRIKQERIIKSRDSKKTRVKCNGGLILVIIKRRKKKTNQKETKLLQKEIKRRKKQSIQKKIALFKKISKKEV